MTTTAQYRRGVRKLWPYSHCHSSRMLTGQVQYVIRDDGGPTLSCYCPTIHDAWKTVWFSYHFDAPKGKRNATTD